METHKGEREHFFPLTQSHLPLSSGVICLDMILVDEGSLYMTPMPSSARKAAQETAMEVITGSMHRNCPALLPLPQETWAEAKTSPLSAEGDSRRAPFSPSRFHRWDEERQDAGKEEWATSEL